MWVERNNDWTLNITKCLWYCQKDSAKKCWKWCRNKQEFTNINSELFFSDINISSYADIKWTELIFKEKVESILKNIY